MPAYHDFLKENESYAASFGDKASLSIPPGKKLAVVTCMDARIDTLAQLGLKEGDAHIIRNAGGVAKDALRSLIISQRLLGTREIALFHHTGCGMTTFSTSQLRELVRSSGATSAEIERIDFHEFADVDSAVKSDVEWLKKEPLILPETVITGWVYEVETGKVRQII